LKIPFNKPFIVGDELANISRAVEQGQLSGDGPYTRLCHQWLEERLGCAKALLTHSCTAALEMAAILCGIRPGDEVIMPSYTFVSTANAFVLRGGVPVFVDIRRDTLNLDERLVEQAVTPATRAIVPVHYAGVACEMDSLLGIARRHGLRVVEDAAQALLSSYKGRMLGAIGDLGCLSFHETKNVISGEGGALLINDPALAERAEIIREKGTDRSRFFRGQVDKYTWVDIGSSYLPSELVGAFLYAQLQHAEEIMAKRRRLCDLYRAALAPLAQRGLLELPGPLPDGAAANGHLVYVLLPDPDIRAGLIRHLRSEDILAVFHYIPLHSSPAGLKHGRAGSAMAVTDELSERLLRLPLYYAMREQDVGEVVGAVERFFRAR
jgi:dTDP-4-amino-4,6-dideoxygalactose transaminase